MTCADPTKKTPAIPIIFNQLGNWQCDKNAGFVQRSETLFSMVLVIIAIELVVSRFRSPPSSITLLWPLRQPLDALANFLEYWVGTMCEVVHLQFGIPYELREAWSAHCMLHSTKKPRIITAHRTYMVSRELSFYHL